MKITCQACQSKYTIADDKIQGKVAKIRCRKCGATVLVDASQNAAGQANGAETDAAAPAEWLVSVAEGDQRTMRLAEVIDAYNGGVITGDTYMWKDGMGDWQPLSEMGEIVDALNAAAGNATGVDAAPDLAPAVQVESPPAFVPTAVAARREPARGRSHDLFASRVADEEVATSAPSHVLSRGATAGKRRSGCGQHFHRGSCLAHSHGRILRAGSRAAGPNR